jgi:4-carboxymuconolactone decarboxylase
MPRLPEVNNRDAVAEKDRAAYDYLAETRGAMRLPFSVIFNAPELCQRVASVGTYCRFEASLPKKIIELATLAAAREFDCGFEWAAHAPQAINQGASQAAVDAIGNRKPLDGLSEEEALPIRAVREILGPGHRLSDATFEAVRARYGDKGVLEIVATAGYYGMLASLINATEIMPPPDRPVLP